MKPGEKFPLVTRQEAIDKRVEDSIDSINKAWIGFFDNKGYPFGAKLFLAFFRNLPILAKMTLSIGIGFTLNWILLMLGSFYIPFISEVFNISVHLYGGLGFLTLSGASFLLTKHLEKPARDTVRSLTEKIARTEIDEMDHVRKLIVNLSDEYGKQSIEWAIEEIEKNISAIERQRQAINSTLTSLKEIETQTEKTTRDIAKLQSELENFDREYEPKLAELKQSKDKLQKALKETRDEGIRIALRANALEIARLEKQKRPELISSSTDAIKTVDAILEDLQQKRDEIEDMLDASEELDRLPEGTDEEKKLLT